MKKTMKKKKGFTLIEVIIVIAIIAILAAVAVPNFMGIMDSAKRSAAVADAAEAANAMNIYNAQVASASQLTKSSTNLLTSGGALDTAGLLPSFAGSDTDQIIANITTDGRVFRALPQASCGITGY